MDRSLRAGGLVLALVAIGCKRQGESPAVLPTENPDPGLVVTSGGRDAAPAASDAAQARLQNEVCPPRVLGRDPGPTPGEQERRRLGPAPDTADVKDECLGHAQCKARNHGRCVHQREREVTTFGQPRIIPAHNECVYDECMSDDECRRTGTYEPRAELVCTCGAERNTCTFANCRQDSDCPRPFTCGPWHYCYSAADTCRADASCKAGEHCVYSWEVKHYVCQQERNIAPD